MNIAFDATAILGELGRNRGIGNYTANQFNTMIKEDRENTYFCLNFFEGNVIGEYIDFQENVSEIRFYTGKENVLLKNVFYENIIGDIIKKFINEYHIDVFYITSPFDCSMYPYKEDWFKNTKVVATVYDLIPYAMKDKYFPQDNGLVYYLERIDMLKWMDHYFVISNSVKEDMIRFFDFSEKKITVIWGAVDNRFKKLEKVNREAVCKKFGIKNNYIMCTGGDDDRKNIDGLIQGFAEVPAQIRAGYQLVIVCKISQESINRYMDIAKEKHIAKELIFTNFVSDDELVQLYNCASAMAFVSKYEGFGLPVVEAFACQIPVITSNNSSLGEIAENAAITVDPYSIPDISRGLQTFLTMADAEEMIQKGIEKLKIYNWLQVTNSTLDILKLIEHRNVKKVSRLAFFTPLPPIESGISDYSVDILNAISGYYDVIDVFIDDGYEPICMLNDNVRIYNYKKYNPNKYDETIYQVGNSDFHTYMFAGLKKYGGIVELHDCNLHLLVRHISFGKGEYDLHKYCEILREDMTEEQISCYLQEVDNRGFSPYTVTINGFVTNYASKIIVHSLWAKNWLIRKDFKRDARYIPLYSKIEPVIKKSMYREMMGYNDEDFIIASFGIIHQTKRVIPIIKAIKKLKDDGYSFRYIFVGKFGGDIEKEFNSTIERLGLSAIVKATGFTDLDDFEHYIDISDICVNLRYPYNGETSAACSRTLAKGKCVLVNRIGAFSEIPEEACVKLPNVEQMSEIEEINTIYIELKKLMDDRALIESYEIAARTYAEKSLNISKIAEYYSDIVNDDFYIGAEEAAIRKLAMDDVKAKKYSAEEIKKLCETISFPKK